MKYEGEVSSEQMMAQLTEAMDHQRLLLRMLRECHQMLTTSEAELKAKTKEYEDLKKRCERAEVRARHFEEIISDDLRGRMSRYGAPSSAGHGGMGTAP